MWVFSCIIFFGIAGLFVFLGFREAADPIGDEIIAQIKVGMSQREVEVLIGQAPSYDCPRDGLLSAEKCKVWRIADSALIIGFDTNGNVLNFIAAKSEPRDTFVKKVWRWIGLR